MEPGTFSATVCISPRNVLRLGPDANIKQRRFEDEPDRHLAQSQNSSAS